MTAAASSTSTAPPHARGGLLAPRGDCRVGQAEGLRSTCGRLPGLLAALGQKSRNEFGLLAARAGSSRRVRPLGEGAAEEEGRDSKQGPSLAQDLAVVLSCMGLAACTLRQRAPKQQQQRQRSARARPRVALRVPRAHRDSIVRLAAHRMRIRTARGAGWRGAVAGGHSIAGGAGAPRALRVARSAGRVDRLVLTSM